MGFELLLRRWEKIKNQKTDQISRVRMPKCLVEGKEGDQPALRILPEK